MYNAARHLPLSSCNDLHHQCTETNHLLTPSSYIIIIIIIIIIMKIVHKVQNNNKIKTHKN